MALKGAQFVFLDRKKGKLTLVYDGRKISYPGDLPCMSSACCLD